jgi:methyl-accepting chemotaxis protein WspA
MKNLRVWQKLAVMGAVFLLLFAVVTWKMTSSLNVLGVEFTRQEIRGLEYYTPALALVKSLQLHRGMSSAWLNGEASFKERLDAQRMDVESQIVNLDEVDRRLDSALHTTATWSVLRAACRELLSKSSSLSASESFDRHSKLIADVLALIVQMGHASNLTLDPGIGRAHLSDVLIFRGPELLELLGLAREFGRGLAASTDRTPAQLEKLNHYATLVEFVEGRLDAAMNDALMANESLKLQLEPAFLASSDAALAATAEIMRLAAVKNAKTDPASYFAVLSRAIDSIVAMEGRAAASLNGLLNERVSALRREVLQTLAWVALGLLAVCLIGVAIIRDVTVTLGQLVGVANHIATGDVTVDAAATSRQDEIGVLARAFERMLMTLRGTVDMAQRIAAGDLAVAIHPQSERDVMGHALSKMVERLSALISQVQESGIQVNTSVNEIAATARQQQATAGEIAATTSEVSATSKQISATSQELVRTMQEVSTVTEQSAALAGSGQVGVTQMEATMRHVMEAAASISAKLTVLSEKAGNITQVVTTITKVADQTNLLSLNAAIEAEKAGEYGRGFAVVATEIRRLADQTAVASYDIEQIVKEIQSAVSAGVMSMDKFTEQVRRGMHDVQEVGGQLSQIIQQVQALAPRVESVNEGMQAQATGAEQITQALDQLSEAAQQTVTSLRESSRAIDGLHEASTGLRSGVARFTLAA